MIADECRAHGLGAISLRYFNVAGASGPLRRGPRARDPPDPAGPAGRRRHARARVDLRHRLPDARRHRRARLHPRRGPRPRAHARARRDRRPATHQILNLGNGARLLRARGDRGRARVTGRDIPVREEPRRPGDPPQLVAASREDPRVLGWEPRARTSTTMIADAWAWHQANPDGYGQAEPSSASASTALGRLRRRRAPRPALRLGRGELVVGGARPRSKNAACSRSSRSAPRRGRRAAHARRRDRCAAAACGRAQAAGGEGVERADRVDAEAAPGALVGERGVHEAVEQHPVARARAAGAAAPRRAAPARRRRAAPRPAAPTVSAGSLTSARMRSDSSTPPGSRSTSTGWPRRAAPRPARRRASSCPAPSRPSDRDQHAATVSGYIDSAAVLALDAHPHAAAVLGSALAAGRPAHAYLLPARRARASAPPRAPSPPSCCAEGAPDPDNARARVRARRAPRPDLGRAQRRARDAARRRRRGGRRRRLAHAVRGAPARLRHRARRHDERRGRQHAAQDARGAAVLRRPAAAHRPPEPGAADDRLALPARALRPAGRRGARRATSSARRSSPPPRCACARLSLGDAERALALALGDGPRCARRRGVRARAAARRRPPAPAVAAAARGGRGARAARARASSRRRATRSSQFLPKKEHRKRDDRVRRAHQARRAPRRARRALDHGLQLAGLWFRDLACVAAGAPELAHHADRAEALARTPTGRAAGRCARRSSWSRTRARGLRSTSARSWRCEALAYRLERRCA